MRAGRAGRAVMGGRGPNHGTASSVEFVRYQLHGTACGSRSRLIYAGGDVVRMGYRNACMDDIRQGPLSWLDGTILTFRGIVAGWYCAQPPARDSQALQNRPLIELQTSHR